VSEARSASPQLVGDRLRRLHKHLQIAHAGVVVAAAALEHQNADRDREIACVLRHCVGERLFAQIDRTAELIVWLQAQPTDPDELYSTGWPDEPSPAARKE
jgi:hypothetical protein